MEITSAIAEVEREWDFDSGFLGRLRRDEFDTASLNRLLRVLKLIHTEKDIFINRRLVSLLWYMPLFMEWQKERVHEAGCDMAAFNKAINQVQSQVERILGVP